MFLCVAVLLCKYRVAEYCITFFTPRSKVPSVYIRVTAGQYSTYLVRFSSFKVAILLQVVEIYRYAIDKVLLEFPGGTIEENEEQSKGNYRNKGL
jgi:hypothetical protein